MIYHTFRRNRVVETGTSCTNGGLVDRKTTRCETVYKFVRKTIKQNDGLYLHFLITLHNNVIYALSHSIEIL